MTYNDAEKSAPQSEIDRAVSTLDRGLFLVERVRALRQLALGPVETPDGAPRILGSSAGAASPVATGTLTNVYQSAVRLDDAIDTALQDIEVLYVSLSMRS